MKFSSLKASRLVLLAGRCSLSPLFRRSSRLQRPQGTNSFTISTAQPWTDTGVDLKVGEVLQINATSAENCDPAGVSGAAGAGLPVGLGARRSIDRQVAGSRRARPDRQRP